MQTIRHWKEKTKKVLKRSQKLGKKERSWTLEKKERKGLGKKRFLRFGKKRTIIKHLEETTDKVLESLGRKKKEERSWSESSLN